MNYERYLFSSASRSTLSNFYQGSRRLCIWNKSFASSEQAYQHFKAVFHGHWEIAVEILREGTSVGCYRLGKGIKTSTLWQKEKVRVMLHILKHKVYQCAEFREELLQNRNKVFCEDTKNQFWGLGKGGKGLNTLGVLLHMLVVFWDMERLNLAEGCDC